MSSKFHNKFHRTNHHTYRTSDPRYPDSSYDPIASPEQPFQGDFILNGPLSASSSLSSYAGFLNCLSGTALIIQGTPNALSAIGSITGLNTTVQLNSSVAIGSYSFATNTATASGNYSHAEGAGLASGSYSHAEGGGVASGSNSHSEGSSTTASGSNSHAEGYNTTASGSNSHAENGNNTASGNNSHAEGYQSAAVGIGAHAEGYNTSSRGEYSHTEGYQTSAIGAQSHAQNRNTTAIGSYSHAEGQYSAAYGTASHAGGFRATAAQNYTYAWSDGLSGTAVVNTSSTRMGQYMISASGGVYIPGNVGIGTDSNANSLTVAGNISSSGTTYLNDLYVTNLTALSSTINVLDIKISEVSGFRSTGPVEFISTLTVLSSVTATPSLYLNSTDVTAVPMIRLKEYTNNGTASLFTYDASRTQLSPLAPKWAVMTLGVNVQPNGTGTDRALLDYSNGANFLNFENMWVSPLTNQPQSEFYTNTTDICANRTVRGFSVIGNQLSAQLGFVTTSYPVGIYPETGTVNGWYGGGPAYSLSVSYSAKNTEAPLANFNNPDTSSGAEALLRMTTGNQYSTDLRGKASEFRILNYQARRTMIALVSTSPYDGVIIGAKATEYTWDPRPLAPVHLADNTLVSGYLKVNNGMYSVSAYNGSYTDGIIADYVTGNGRISVGPQDNISFYTGGPATTTLVIFASTGNVGIKAANPTSVLTVSGSLATLLPINVTTASYTVPPSASSLIHNAAAGTYTLPAAATYPGQWLYIKTLSAVSVNSASSNVVQLTSVEALTTILPQSGPAAIGKWAHLQSDGTNWVVMAAN